MNPRKPYNPKWVRAIQGPLGNSIPQEWLRRKDPMGNYNLWVVYQKPSDHPKHFVVRHWQVTGTGKIRTASEPRILSDSLLEARATIPYGLLRVALGVPDLKIIEVWF